MRPRLLRAFGWHTHRVLTIDWFARADEVFQEILAVLEAAEPPPTPEASGDAPAVDPSSTVATEESDEIEADSDPDLPLDPGDQE